MKKIFIALCAVMMVALTSGCAQKKEPAKVLVLTERGGQHGPFTDAGIEWLNAKAQEMNFELTEVNTHKGLDKETLMQYDMMIQLDYVSYVWGDDMKEAMQAFLADKSKTWIGFHHAGLLGDFDGFKMWDWFSDFMGSIEYNNYNANLLSGKVDVEDADHPVMEGVAPSFIVPDDEWYIYNKSPRPNVRVLASVDEDSYESEIKMGDHPVIWTNESVEAKNVYFMFGHSPKLYETEDFVKMFTNALNWGLR